MGTQSSSRQSVVNPTDLIKALEVVISLAADNCLDTETASSSGDYALLDEATRQADAIKRVEVHLRNLISGLHSIHHNL